MHSDCNAVEFILVLRCDEETRVGRLLKEVLP